ncbi:hypothetical protein [Luteolibacter luteus]|uniref:DUF5703 domain-containing protein n=1 Tax=Luteolibacter luteus TaxID=2728835 RepID=A0A858RED5_9BACT|nr:hypothetical protein [Luteolibacter luteus]QJE94924.1 hypothetical protein HHL09_03735 [Luteolibacter luteus]
MVRPALLLFLSFVSTASAELLDTLVFGNGKSEAAHQLSADLSETKTGGLGETSRQLLAGGEQPWLGGVMKFSIRVNPEQQNYFTVRLWGDDVNHNQLTFHVEGKQVGYRHLGDIEALDIGTDAPAYPGRFYYRTCPLPLGLTKGKDHIACEIRATGPIWGYGKNFEEYQKAMTRPTRGLYRAYTHTEGCFIPPGDEKQGVNPGNAPVRQSPGPEVIEQAKERVNDEIERTIREPKKPCNQMQTLFLAKARHTPWTIAADKPQTIEKIVTSLDSLYRGYVADPRLAQAEPSTYNPDWFGLGPAGQVIDLLKEELKPFLDQEIDDGMGRQIRRRDGFRDMLVACRDWHRENRRQYTNQSMINDLYGIYLANRGIAVLDPAKALPEAQALRYLYESIGIKPWLGSEKDGKPLKPLGDSFYQLTKEGLTKELGFVGNYGEVLDWAAQIYEATRPSPNKPGDAKIKEQIAKIAKARSYFRYPMLDQEGNRAMVQETIVGWRDVHFPGDVTYDQRPSWDGSPFEVAAATLDAHLVGYAQQMLADNQFFAAVEDAVKSPGFRTTFGLLGIPERYEAIKAEPPSSHRLPMSWDQPDFVFADEEDGVIAVKNGKEILYASLYWRARHAVNFLGRVHLITPEFDRIATVRLDTEFTPSGMEYTRPDWTNFGFANGGHRYPAEYKSAHAGEKLPIAQIPEGVAFKAGQENVHAGRGDFYQLRYGSYLIAMNMSADKSFQLKAPRHAGKIRNLATGKPVAPAAEAAVGPRSTIVLYLEANSPAEPKAK